MRTVRIEGTALRSSRLGFGTASLHHVLSSAARHTLLEHAWQCGIRYFDTAPLYGHEMAERELGRFLRGRRADAVLATKFGLLPTALLSRFPLLMYAQKMGGRLLKRSLGGVPARDYGARHARARVDRSLALLGTEYIDILYLHEPTLAMLEAPEELVLALADLKRAGKIRHVGVSGTLEDCASISRRYPSLGEIWQVAMPARSDTARVMEWRGHPVQVTFGHFRSARLAPHASAEEARAARTRSLAEAIEVNPTGVILFSTRRAAHLDDTLAMLHELEPRS